MAAVKKIKKAQNGAKRADNLVTEKKMMPKFIDIEGKRVKGPISDKIDIVARKKAIKDGKFREDLKSGDLFPVKKSGGSLKPVAADQKGLSKLPTPVRNKMGYQKSGGKTKKAMGGAKMMKGGGKCRYGC
jgi:hypothetical protein